MATIVEYSVSKKPLNAFPMRIISPSYPQDCCATSMVQVGEGQTDERGFAFHYRRCRVCGYALRYFLPVLPPEEAPVIGRSSPGPRGQDQAA